MNVEQEAANNMKALYKAKCKVLISTPNQILPLFKKGAFDNTECSTLIIDKVRLITLKYFKIDMHIALDLSSDLEEVAKQNIQPEFKTIITTNFKDDQKGST